MRCEEEKYIKIHGQRARADEFANAKNDKGQRKRLARSAAAALAKRACAGVERCAVARSEV
jgi:hypothetical protein